MDVDNSLTTQPARSSGIKTVLKFIGIPHSWLDKRPKLPSRNWLIFLSCTSSIVGLYIYDRRQCKKIRETYVNKVKHLAEVPVDPFDTPRRVLVYGAKWPADEEYDQCLKYFRKYVKPILIAGAVDYELIPGKRHGDIAKRVAEQIRLRRRMDLGLDQESEATKALPTYRPLSERRKYELNCGVVIVGRPTFKEYMAGLVKGWTQGLENVDIDEELVRILEYDNHFDEPEDPQAMDAASTSQTLEEPSSFYQHGPLHSSPLQTLSPKNLESSNLGALSELSSAIPQLPPLLLVSFTNYIGLNQIPLMIWGFFNQRHKALLGAKAGYSLVMNKTRPIDIPDDLEGSFLADQGNTPNDLDFGNESEQYYKKSMDALPEEIEKSRQKYYETLPAKLAVARDIARGTREPTQSELENPPPTEVELRAERLKHEKRWRSDVEGWEIIKPSAKVSWDHRFRDALRIFSSCSEDDKSAEAT